MPYLHMLFQNLQISYIKPIKLYTYGMQCHITSSSGLPSPCRAKAKFFTKLTVKKIAQHRQLHECSTPF